MFLIYIDTGKCNKLGNWIIDWHAIRNKNKNIC